MEWAAPLKPDISDEETSSSDKMSLSGKYIGAVIAKNLGMELNDFNRYNPGLMICLLHPALMI